MRCKWLCPGSATREMSCRCLCAPPNVVADLPEREPAAGHPWLVPGRAPLCPLQHPCCQPALDTATGLCLGLSEEFRPPREGQTVPTGDTRGRGWGCVPTAGSCWTPRALYRLTKVPVFMQNMDRHRGPAPPMLPVFSCWLRMQRFRLCFACQGPHRSPSHLRACTGSAGIQLKNHSSTDSSCVAATRSSLRQG